MNNLNVRGMASQERAYLSPPCPRPVYVECGWCGRELLDEDSYEIVDYWNDIYQFCSRDCIDEWQEENCDPEVD